MLNRIYQSARRGVKVAAASPRHSQRAPVVIVRPRLREGTALTAALRVVDADLQQLGPSSRGRNVHLAQRNDAGGQPGARSRFFVVSPGPFIIGISQVASADECSDQMLGFRMDGWRFSATVWSGPDASGDRCRPGRPVAERPPLQVALAALVVHGEAQRPRLAGVGAAPDGVPAFTYRPREPQGSTRVVPRCLTGFCVASR